MFQGDALVHPIGLFSIAMPMDIEHTGSHLETTHSEHDIPSSPSYRHVDSHEALRPNEKDPRVLPSSSSFPSQSQFDPWLVTWTNPDLGPDDKTSIEPREWSKRKKWYMVSWCCFMEFGISFASSAYSSGETQIEEEFGISQAAAVLGLTTFVAGLGVGALFLAPMSEKFGRNTVYFSSFVSGSES